MKNIKTTKELYEKLLEMPDLHSKPELDDEILIWKLYIKMLMYELTAIVMILVLI